jgi:hypothetical protein
MNEDEVLNQLSVALQPQRHADESFEAYQKRRKAGNDLRKLANKGIVFWDSRVQGTFVKKD